MGSIWKGSRMFYATTTKLRNFLMCPDILVVGGREI